MCHPDTLTLCPEGLRTTATEESTLDEIGLIKRLRFGQIRIFSKWLEKLSSVRQSHFLLRSLGRSSLLAHALVGYRRSFDSFAAAESYIQRYNLLSHSHPSNVTMHMLHFSEAARVSDFPVLFYLQRILGEAKTVLDIGGSGGNLFYCYSHYLAFPETLRWTVFEVPGNVTRGRQIAAERGESRLHFVDNLDQCPEADVVIISGSLHYFDALPPELLQYLVRKPKHVFINRTPVIDGPSAITVQDAGWYYAMSPARILSRRALLDSMADARFDLVDEWIVPDLRLRIPLHPQSSASAYSGFYFRSRETSKAPVPLIAFPRSFRRVHQKHASEAQSKVRPQ